MRELARDAADLRGPYDMRGSYDVRFEWGAAGAAALAPSSSCLVVVDVLSFSTSVTVAVQAGTRVYPCAWRDETAAAFAREHQAELAAGRRAASDESGAPGLLSVAVIAAGERWPDGSLRPALEDLLGAGAVIAGLVECGVRVLSPEAEATRACFEGTADIAAAVAGSVSGRELAGSGFGEDVAIAVESGSCPLVPVLADGAFTVAT
jgi:2-phosphosulfolactate phosphatase